MARPNRRGRYYNYPNLRTTMNITPGSPMVEEEKAKAQALDSVVEGIEPQEERVTYDENCTKEYEQEEEQIVHINEHSEGGMVMGMQYEECNAGNPRMRFHTFDQDDRCNQSNQDTEYGPSDSEEDGTCRVRFLNAAAGYGALSIIVAGEQISEGLDFGRVTAYNNVPDGFQQVTITMIQDPKAVLLNKQIPFRNCKNTTAAIINTTTGIEIMMISDEGCKLDEEDRACFRVANLSYTSPALDIILENGNPVFEDVRFKYVTEYKQAIPGEYNFNVMLARTAETLQNNTNDLITPEIPEEEGGYPEEEKAYAYFFEEFDAGARYTAYIIGNKDYDPPLKVVTLEVRDDIQELM